MAIDLQTPVSSLLLVGQKFSQRLKKLNIGTVGDLIHHYPNRYEDFSQVIPINKLKPGTSSTIIGRVIACQNVYTRGGRKIQKAIILDASGQIEAAWFNQPYLVKTLKPNTQVALSGKPQFFGQKLTFSSPEFELFKTKEQLLHCGRLVPVYPETYGVSSKWLRSRIYFAQKQLQNRIRDWLPAPIREKEKLIGLEKALRQIHFPKNPIEAEEAKKRLAFDEMLLLQLKNQLQKKEWQKNKLSHPFLIDQTKVLSFIESLPFVLTKSQRLAIKEILADLSQPKPMNRLLQGDVGSGKTVVAGIACYLAYLNNLQSVIMAPTEILANQHYRTLSTLLLPLGIKVALYTGSKKEKLEAAEVIVGTQALIFPKVKFERLGLVVLDEQHRFGVEQRAKLIHKGYAPHLLTMTATPIPRTVSLVLYGNLDVSYLSEMPKGRLAIKTWVVPHLKKTAAYEWIGKQIKTGAQAFIVCPLIETSEKETMKDISAAKEQYQRLKDTVFPEFKLGLLHGRLKIKEKNAVLQEFRLKKSQILVTTPVVEVGIDIPSANIMLIEAADRFGLAQLHQLRGRVGRGNRQSFCLLFVSRENKLDSLRLKAMERYSSGFTLAEIDLKLRGAGEMYGKRQHGFYPLKLASFQDLGLILKTKVVAKNIIQKLDQFPLLKAKTKSYTIKNIEPN